MISYDDFSWQIKQINHLTKFSSHSYKFSLSLITAYSIINNIEPIHNEVKGYYKYVKNYLSIRYTTFTKEHKKQIIDYIYSTLNIKRTDFLFADLINLTITEVLDNIQQHSQSTETFVFIETYSTKKFYDLIIYDNGRGFKKSLENLDESIKDDADALKKVIEEGLSAKKKKKEGEKA